MKVKVGLPLTVNWPANSSTNSFAPPTNNLRRAYHPWFGMTRMARPNKFKRSQGYKFNMMANGQQIWGKYYINWKVISGDVSHASITANCNTLHPHPTYIFSHNQLIGKKRCQYCTTTKIIYFLFPR
jgi:hypothetical protein